jgi:RNA polymerase sigma-70 factor, ECF subfamily
MNTLDDEALLSLIKQDNKLAFRALTERYLNKVWRVTFNILQRQQDAEDAAQDVFINVWNHRKKWVKGEASFSTWIYRVAFNKAIDYKRQRKITCEVDDNLDDGNQSADDLLADKQLHLMFKQCMREIPEKQRLCLSLFYFDELNIEEICDRTNATEDSVRSLLKRGKISLKEILRNRHSQHSNSELSVATYLR